ncbi:hypothetical protein Zmor_007517 [Zophobas morio]|uniref:dCMP deaminase n=2 Tax=Zophobas morio TaxID=2755281 RepID=A0AA38IWS5_9CUCU|nr:hypothetical protein Zmor_024480 [Zophobas morio]KAJ3663213.1 hypothetical protein Zmor_007517 [Zophobas morio]
MASESEEARPESALLSSDECFMAHCLIVAQQSKDPNTQVGACVVDVKGSILGSGYNKMPNGCESLPWSRNHKHRDHETVLYTKYPYVCHAVLNAIISSKGGVEGGTVYTTLFPCYECAKLIIQSGIKKVVYFTDRYEEDTESQGARKLFETAEIDHIEFSGLKDLVIDFTNPRTPLKFMRE